MSNAPVIHDDAFQRTGQRVARPTGLIVPDLSIKRSLVLDKWQAQQRQARGAAIQRDRLQMQARAYDGASVGRLTGDWIAQNTSADSELLTSLRMMRARSRQLVRDNPYARHAVRLLANNVVGTGIGMQAKVVNARGKLQTTINDSIEAAWVEWSKKATCHTAGLLNFNALERLAMVQLVTAGEVIIRKVRQPFGGGRVPLALEVIEADRLLDQWQTARAPSGNAIRMGVEVDEWGRPVAYWFTPRHPGDFQFTTFEPSRFMRVLAEDILHLYVIERWPQTRGEPWFASVLRSLHDVAGYEDATITKARASANIVGFIRSPEPVAADSVEAGRLIVETEPGTWQRLLPGEDVAGASTSGPAPELEPFLRHMVRKMAVGVGISYEANSRDYTAATYSSARMAMLDDRDMYRVLQGFFILNLRQDIHREFMDAAALVGAIKVGADYYSAPAKYQAVRFKPRGWTWIDPTKEVAAYRAAVRAGFMTQGDVIAQTSEDRDFEDLVNERQAETEALEEAGLLFDTDSTMVDDKGVSRSQAAATADVIDDAAPASADVSNEPGEPAQESEKDQ